MEIGTLATVVSAIASCVTAFVAWRAATAWFEQHHLDHTRAVAIRVAHAAAAIRRSFADFRSPFGPPPMLGEATLRARGEVLDDDPDRRRIQIRDAGLNAQYRRIWEAIEGLESLAGEVSLTWNFDMARHVESARDLAFKVGQAMRDHLNGRAGWDDGFDATAALAFAYAGAKEDPVLATLTEVLGRLESVAKERYALALPRGARKRWEAGPAPLDGWNY